ncbi:hypothetical protein ACFVR6_03720 [Microbacterium sp. NPDC058021]|uniref:hypothetical protein n=1 Tax=Microbacterium sp. NPDC058021 TaxID=3346306 RepID=UPI0036DEDDEC
MAAILTTLTGKVLIQVEGMDPVEVGTIEIPIHADVSTLRTSGADTAIPAEDVPPFRPPPTLHRHKPVQHRDGKAPWCNACGLDANYETSVSRLAGKEE